MKYWTEKHIRELVRNWYESSSGGGTAGGNIDNYLVVPNSYKWSAHGIGIDLSVENVKFIETETYTSGFVVIGDLVATGDFPDTTNGSVRYVMLYDENSFMRLPTQGRDANGNRYLFKLGVDGSHIRPNPEILDMASMQTVEKYVICDGELIETATGGIDSNQATATGAYTINGKPLSSITTLDMRSIRIHGLPACHEIRTPVIIGL